MTFIAIESHSGGISQDMVCRHNNDGNANGPSVHAGFDSYFLVDFGESVRIKPTHYSLEHQDQTDDTFMRNWNFEGSNNGDNWDIIMEHNHDQTLQDEIPVFTWKVEKCHDFYRYFRIKQGQCNEQISAGLLEIYGHFLEIIY